MALLLSIQSPIKSFEYSKLINVFFFFEVERQRNFNVEDLVKGIFKMRQKLPSKFNKPLTVEVYGYAGENSKTL